MNPYLEVAGVGADGIADLLGLDKGLMSEWAAGQQPMPPSMAGHLSAILGVPEDALIVPPKQPVDMEEITPTVWFKLRDESLTEADREIVLLARRLGVFQDELESVSGQPEIGWKTYFSEILGRTDPEASPLEQGREAARLFRAFADFGKGKIGVGGLLRPSLRRLGILVIESPVKGSRVEGCSFFVGRRTAQRPCIFLNSYQTSWFRRNELLAHELAHAIFELSNSGAVLDYSDEEVSNLNVAERRANAFAQEALVPAEVLNHLASQHGLAWRNMGANELAILVAETQVERRLVLKAAVEAGFLGAEGIDELKTLDIAQRLKQLTNRALSTREYLERIPEEAAQQWRGKRNTSLPSRRLRLPVPYIKAVIEAQGDGMISVGRAARLLMITSEEYSQRFPPQGLDEDTWG